jgi:chemotaxis protein CheD
MIYLQPGEWQVVRTPAILKTLLGSCVGITFRAPRLGASAMCHPMLPHYAARSRFNSNRAATGRYVDSVIDELARAFDRLGARRGEIEVKLFGGADVLATSGKRATVGKMNCDAAMRVLDEQGFRLSASRLGGTHGISIEFHTKTGEVRLRSFAQMDPAALTRT